MLLFTRSDGLNLQLQMR